MLMMESQETRSHVAARRPGRSGLRTQKEASCVMHHDSRPKMLELAQESCTSSPHSLAFCLLANGCGRPDGPGRQPCHTSKAFQVTETAVPPLAGGLALRTPDQGARDDTPTVPATIKHTGRHEAGYNRPYRIDIRSPP